MAFDREAVRVRCEAATKGPMRSVPDPGVECDRCDAAFTEYRLIKAPSGAGIYVVLGGDNEYADSAFAEHAHTDLPAALAEIDAREEVLVAVRNERNLYQQERDVGREREAALREEIDALERELAAARERHDAEQAAYASALGRAEAELARVRALVQWVANAAHDLSAFDAEPMGGPENGRRRGALRFDLDALLADAARDGRPLATPDPFNALIAEVREEYTRITTDATEYEGLLPTDSATTCLDVARREMPSSGEGTGGAARKRALLAVAWLLGGMLAIDREVSR